MESTTGYHQISSLSSSRQVGVLIVDDEKIVLDVCAKSLAKVGYRVHCAGNGLEALDMIREVSNIDIVITDHKMPGKNGIELLKDIKRDYPHIEVILMTGYATIENAIAAMKIGASEFILKPLKVDQIRMVVRKCYERIKSNLKIKRLSEANKKLRDLEDLKNKFLAITSHELRTPVSHLKGYLNILKEELFERMNPEERESCIRVMETAINDLDEIVNNMFDLVKYNNKEIPLRLEDVNVNEILKEVYNEFNAVIQENNRILNFRLELSPQISAIPADRLKVKVVASNLVQNAVKFTKDHGEIIIRSFDQAAFVVLCVKDNGIGIPESEFGSIFLPLNELIDTRYHSTGKYKFKGGGLGLGLPLAQAIAKAHGGGIRVNSKIGFGSSFYVYLPKNREDEPDFNELHATLVE